ncbi:hypothetical protein CSUI_010478, partial [Cystoisospora suis]
EGLVYVRVPLPNCGEGSVGGVTIQHSRILVYSQPSSSRAERTSSSGHAESVSLKISFLATRTTACLVVEIRQQSPTPGSYMSGMEPRCIGLNHLAMVHALARGCYPFAGSSI